MSLKKSISSSTIIPPDFLVKTLESRHFKDGHNYKLQTLLRFVIDLSPEDMLDFVADQEQEQEQTTFLQTVNYLKPISYPAVINIFTDLSALYVIFKRQMEEKHGEEKPIESSNNFTRKIKLHIPMEKAKRKGKRTITKKHKLYVEKA